MSDYRRLISYIYEYEGKEKGKNVGFVKLEARNGQCRLNLSVKKVYMGSSAIGVFLLSKAGTEVFLGNIFIRSGAGEFRAVVDAKNVEGNGGGLDTYYGLTIHDVKNPWRSYTTIWEDAVEPETLPGSLPGDQGNGDTVKMLPAQEILPGSPDQSEEEPVMAVASVVREIEAEIAREEEREEPGGNDPGSGVRSGDAAGGADRAVHSGRPGCGAGAVCGASARGAAGEAVRTASSRGAASKAARTASTRRAASKAARAEGDTGRTGNSGFPGRAAASSGSWHISG